MLRNTLSGCKVHSFSPPDNESCVGPPSIMLAIVIAIHKLPTFRDAGNTRLPLLPPLIQPQVIMPLGGIPKSDVRRIARRFGLPTAERAESMGVCFIGERGNFGDFVGESQCNLYR